MTVNRSAFLALPLCAGLASSAGLVQDERLVPVSSVVGQWNVTFYPEPNLVTAATQGICFLSNGTWFSTTFSNWKGDWFLKGDRFRWYGHTSAISTAEFGQFISNTTFNGESAHFFASATSVPPLTSSRGNYQATKVSTVCNRAASGPAKSGADPSAK